MGFEAKVLTILSIFAILLFGTSSATNTNDAPFHASLDSFSKNMFSELFQLNGHKNLIFSPFSMQTCLAMVRMAAGGQTAAELDQGLSFTGQSAESVADNYHTMLAKYENSNILKIANKVYLMEGYELQDKYTEVLSEKFFSSAENIDFGHSAKAAAAMNTWVESKTNNVIKDLIKPDMVSGDTRMFLLSAIHFKGNWESAFDVKNTEERDFYTDETNSVKVQMMFKKSNAYAIFSELDAKAVLLPYQDSDLSMMIILPDSRNGLAALEEKLRNVALKSLTEEISDQNGKADIRVPKFKAEFEIELSEVLQKMGMRQMFSNADFSKMLKSPGPLAVSTAIHKAFIEVNEEGTEAAAVTGIGAFWKSIRRATTFVADHPFYYVIMNEDSVPLFQGTFVGN